MSIGLLEILVIALILVLVFGSKRIPAFMEDLGKGVKQLRGITLGKDGSKPPEGGPPSPGAPPKP
jgi:TatA/E family protein of Tat protein translocase